jgi:hypothetical protein
MDVDGALCSRIIARVISAHARRAGSRNAARFDFRGVHASFARERASLRASTRISRARLDWSLFRSQMLSTEK